MSLYEVALVSAAFGGVAATFYAIYRQSEHEKANAKRHALNSVFDLMNTKEHRQARTELFTAYFRCLEKYKKPTEFTYETFEEHIKEASPIDVVKETGEGLRPHADRVRADFSQIAVMIHHGMLDAKVFDDMYWATTLRVYAALRGNIEIARKVGGVTQHTTKLQKQCEDRILPYWRNNHKESKIRFYANDEQGIIRRASGPR